MQILIIILIVVLIAQTSVFIYANFIDLSNKRNAADTQKMITDAQSCYLADKARLQMCVDNREQQVHEWSKKYSELAQKYNQLGHIYEELKKKFDDKTGPFFRDELQDKVTDLVTEYFERGFEFDNDHSLDMDFGIETEDKKYDVLLQVVESEKEDTNEIP